MAPWRAIKEMERDTRIVRHGLGTLLLKCERADDGIAILHSYPSTFANKIAAGHSYGKYEAAHTAWHRALRALGLQFSYVTDRMLRRGEFQARRYKMLILPQAEAISPREADVIRDFAANGGCVIADVRPGLYDGHCKAVPQGVLRDLFGVESTGNTKAVRRVARISGDLGGRPVELSFPNAKTDPAVRPTSGRPAGSAGAAPLVIVNPAGRGRAVLLNFRMDSFPAINTDAPTPGAAGFVDALLAMGGVQAKVAITHADGSPVRDTELIRFHGQGVDFLALFGGKDETVQVHLPEPRYVYDLREHASRGRKATFIAISERPLTGPRIRPRSRRVSRGEQLRLRISYPGSGARHAARLRLFRPDGSHAEWFDRVVITGGDGTRITLPIAYNDPAGRWTIRAIDLYTDEAAEVKVMVR